MVKTMNVSNVMVLVVAMVATTSVFMLHEAEAAEYTVGDELGWTIPPPGAPTYASWASKHSLVVNDILAFNFTVGEQDLASVTKEDFDSCNTTDPIVVFQNPGTFQFSRVGTFYLTCTFAGHCSKGQKVALFFAPNSTDSPSPSPSQSQSGAAHEEYSTAVKFGSKKEYGLKK